MSKNLIRKIISPCILILDIILTSCGSKSVPASLSSFPSAEEPVSRCYYSDYECTVTETGVIYPNNAQQPAAIKYYDFATEEEYVLCSRSGCRHQDESCSAFYPSFVCAPVISDGLLYLFSFHDSDGGWDFISASVDGTGRKTLVSLLPSDFQCDSLMGGISDVFYVDDTVYFFLELTNWDSSSKKACVRINMLTGKCDIREVSPAWKLIATDGKHAAVTFEGTAGPLLTEADFYKENGAAADYNAYYQNWFLTSHLQYYGIWDFEADDVLESVSFQGEMPEHDYSRNVWDGTLYITHNTDLYALDLETGDCSSVLHTDHFYTMECRAGDNVFVLELDKDSRQRRHLAVYHIADGSADLLDDSFLGDANAWVFRSNQEYCIGYGRHHLNYGLFSIPIEDFLAEKKDHIRFIKYQAL